MMRVVITCFVLTICISVTCARRLLSSRRHDDEGDRSYAVSPLKLDTLAQHEYVSNERALDDSGMFTSYIERVAKRRKKKGKGKKKSARRSKRSRKNKRSRKRTTKNTRRNKVKRRKRKNLKKLSKRKGGVRKRRRRSSRKRNSKKRKKKSRKRRNRKSNKKSSKKRRKRQNKRREKKRAKKGPKRNSADVEKGLSSRASDANLVTTNTDNAIHTQNTNGSGENGEGRSCEPNCPKNKCFVNGKYPVGSYTQKRGRVRLPAVFKPVCGLYDRDGNEDLEKRNDVIGYDCKKENPYLDEYINFGKVKNDMIENEAIYEYDCGKKDFKDTGLCKDMKREEQTCDEEACKEFTKTWIGWGGHAEVKRNKANPTSYMAIKYYTKLTLVMSCQKGSGNKYIQKYKWKAHRCQLDGRSRPQVWHLKECEKEGYVDDDIDFRRRRLLQYGQGRC